MLQACLFLESSPIWTFRERNPFSAEGPCGTPIVPRRRCSNGATESRAARRPHLGVLSFFHRNPQYGKRRRTAPHQEPGTGTGEVRILWDSYSVNCGSRCALRVHVKGGEITHMETDNTGDERYGMQQIRAYPLGRSMRQRIHAEQRIPYPLYRVTTGGKQVQAHQMGGTLRGNRTEAARHHRHLWQRGRPSELRHGCDRQYHRQKSASGRYARCPAHESCRRFQSVVRVAAAANGTFPTARRSLPPMRKKMTKCDFCRDYLE